VDKRHFSHKFNPGTLKYEVAMDVYRLKIVWISGPHRGGKHDNTVLDEGLKDKIWPGKMAIANRGYSTRQQPGDQEKLSLSNSTDDKALENFKSWARLRQEIFNGRLKFFRALSDTFRHCLDNHKHTFEAVCVIVQYQMDNGKELFETE
jgi:hypothetical protein